MQKAIPKRWMTVPESELVGMNFQGRSSYQLRMSRRIDRLSFDTLLEQIDSLEPLEDALTILFEETRMPGEFPGDLPEDWIRTEQTVGQWYPVAEAPGIEVLILEEPAAGERPSLAISFRGVMTEKVHADLVRRFGSYKMLKETIDGWADQSVPATGRFLGRFVLTVSRVFPVVYVFSSSQGPPGDQRDTFVIVAANRTVDFSKIAETGLWQVGPFASWIQTANMSEPKVSGQMDSLLGLSESQVLTDDFAPVDNLLAPVFERQSDQ